MTHYNVDPKSETGKLLVVAEVLRLLRSGEGVKILAKRASADRAVKLAPTDKLMRASGPDAVTKPWLRRS